MKLIHTAAATLAVLSLAALRPAAAQTTVYSNNFTGGYLTGGNYAPQTGATEANTLGYFFGGPEDAVYHLCSPSPVGKPRT